MTFIFGHLYFRRQHFVKSLWWSNLALSCVREPGALHLMCEAHVILINLDRLSLPARNALLEGRHPALVARASYISRNFTGTLRCTPKWLRRGGILPSCGRAATAKDELYSRMPP